MFSIDLNADLGEGCGDDAAMLAVVSSANVACGTHAGSPVVLMRTIDVADAHAVRVGAHVGYPNREQFGRESMASELSDAELHGLLRAQLAAFSSLNRDKVPFVKAHGALYNDATVDDRVASILAYEADVVGASLLHQPGSRVAVHAARFGMRIVSEGFADRAYRPDGTLVPRSCPGAVLTDATVVAQRAVRMAVEQKVQAIDGSELAMPVESICVHGDTAGAVRLAGAVRAALRDADVAVRSFVQS